MKKAILLAAAAFALASPVLAEKKDCDEGFKGHMKNMSIYVDKMSGYELADAVRKSLDVYNTCKSGDTFSPYGVWDQIIADMKAKANK
ncbi:MAG: hypothetical protein ACXW4Z_18885 [Candidatus Binatia bacterium]